MSKFYRFMNNPVFTFIGKLLDIIVLHFFWVVCSLPVITFGAATTALYYACMKEAEDKEGHYFRQFFKSFKLNLKQGIVIGLVFLLIEGGLAYTIYICTVNLSADPMFSFFRIMAIAMAVIILMIFEFVFPLQARFDNTIINTVKNGFLMMVRHIGWTIVITIILVGFYVLMIIFERYLFPLYVMGFGLVAFVQSFILNHVLSAYIEESEKKGAEETENNLD